MINLLNLIWMRNLSDVLKYRIITYRINNRILIDNNFLFLWMLDFYMVYQLLNLIYFLRIKILLFNWRYLKFLKDFLLKKILNFWFNYWINCVYTSSRSFLLFYNWFLCLILRTKVNYLFTISLIDRIIVWRSWIFLLRFLS